MYVYKTEGINVTTIMSTLTQLLHAGYTYATQDDGTEVLYCGQYKVTVPADRWHPDERPDTTKHSGMGPLAHLLIGGYTVTTESPGAERIQSGPCSVLVYATDMTPMA